MKLKLHHLGTVSLASLMLLTAVPAAIAQDSDTESGDTIVVTGTRIQRQDYVSQSPLVTTDIEFVNNSGRATVDDYIKDLPQFAPGTGDYSNDSNGGTAGRATLNLRNLGSKRNLVIMDGRRLMSSGTDGAIDINTIPTLAIGSIETISGGASATYGSDALSGVVNFKTRTDLDGFEVLGQYTTLDDAGEDSYKIGAAYGTSYADDRGSLLISGEYLDRGGVRYFERDFFNVNPQASSFTVYGRSRVGRSWLSVDNDGTVFVTDRGTPFGSDPNNVFGDPVELPLIVDGNGGIRTHGQYRNWIQVPLEQMTLFGKTEYEFENGVTGYAQGLFASSTAFNVGAEPISAGVWGVTIPGDNYWLTQVPDLDAVVGPNGIGTFQARIVQAGNRNYNTENDVFQLLGGFKGSSNTRDLNWDIHASYGRTKTTDKTLSGSINFVALQELIDTTDPLTGVTPLCAGGYNPFGGTTPLSDACLDYISRTPVNETTLGQTVIEGILEGKLKDLPAGESRFALTAHFRENSFDFVPDPDIAAAELANLSSSQATDGKIQVAEFAGEVLLPILAKPETSQALNLTLGARHSHYNQSGTALTYKAEFDGRISDNILIRGGYQHALRAPNINELFSPDLLRVNPFDDPCSGRYRGPRLDQAAEDALCVRLGENGFVQGGSSAPTITSGNPDLIPEEADTFTLGAVFDFDVGNANVKLSGDYYNIKVDEAIEVLAAADVFIKCFNLDGTSNPTYDENYIACQQISYSQGGIQLDPVNQPILNLGGIKTSGFDIAANISVPVDALGWGGGDGRIVLNSIANILDKYEVQAFVDEDFVDYAGTVSTTTASPKLKMLNSLTAQSGPVSVIGTWRHISSMDDRSAATNASTTIEGASAYNYFDITGRVTFMDNYEIFAGVNNVTDKAPPQIGGSTDDGVFSGTNQGVYDGIGRAFFVGAKARF